jgi:hypothetical protein
VRGPEDWRLAYLTFAVFALGVVAFPLFPLFLLVSYVLGRAAMAAAAEKGVVLGARRWLVYPPVVLVGLSLLLAVLFWPVVAAGAASESVWEAERFRELVAVNPDGSLTFTRPLRYEYEATSLGVRKAADGRWEMSVDRRAYYQGVNRAVDAFPGPQPVQAGLAIAFAAAGAVAAWWVVLGGLGWAWPGLPRAVFAPLTGGFEARHGRRLFTVALIGLVLWAGFAYRVAAAATTTPVGDRPPATTTK